MRITLEDNAVVRLPFRSEKQLLALKNALTPEVSSQIGSRSKTTLCAEDKSLILTIEAKDTVALRAAVNAYLRWINSVVNVLDQV